MGDWQVLNIEKASDEDSDSLGTWFPRANSGGLLAR